MKEKEEKECLEMILDHCLLNTEERVMIVDPDTYKKLLDLYKEKKENQ